MKSYIFILLVFVVSVSKAQFDKEKFEDVFDEEVDDSKYSKRENHSGIYNHTQPQTIPDWFINLPPSNNNEIYAIGISEPETDTTNAFETAVYRAQIMANILKNSTTQLLCDFFVNEVNESRDIVYEHFSRINSKLPEESNFEVIETYRNNFDETMVLIKYNTKSTKKSEQKNKIIFELYKNEIESSNYGELESIYELKVQAQSISETDPMLYQLTEFKDRSDISNATNNIEKQIPIYSLRYNITSTTDSVQYCNYSHGLWKEFFKSVMVVILSKAREKPENIKYLVEDYDKKSLQKTTRGISVNRMSFILTGVIASKNKINVTLREIPVK